jgi:hypothetical protein
MKTLKWQLPLKTVSEANCFEHYQVKSKRHRQQKRIIRLWSIENNVRATTPLPCTIKLVRLANRELDEEDNLRMAFKYVKDYIADELIPGLAPGRADGDKRIKWEYGQEKSNLLSIRIEVSFSAPEKLADIDHV